MGDSTSIIRLVKVYMRILGGQESQDQVNRGGVSRGGFCYRRGCPSSLMKVGWDMMLLVNWVVGETETEGNFIVEDKKLGSKVMSR